MKPNVLNANTNLESALNIKSKDELGDRMKMYEGTSDKRLMPLLPVMARLDGRAFSKFTKGMQRPFDPVFTGCMIETTKALVAETNANMGYTQSDEITLTWYSDNIKSQIWFDGRLAKMTSQLAAHATLTFYRLILERMPEFAKKLPTFDARVWNVPNKVEASNVFVWREWDATKNSITMAASSYYSHNELLNKSGSMKQDMLHAKGVNWNEYPTSFKRGTYVQRGLVQTAFTFDELAKLPPKHEAHSNPDFMVERRIVNAIHMPPITSVTNRVAVIFDGVQPEFNLYKG